MEKFKDGLDCKTTFQALDKNMSSEIDMLDIREAAKGLMVILEELYYI